MKESLLLFFSITILFTNPAFAQVPNIDTSIIDKTNDMLEKTGDMMEKTSEMIDKTEGMIDQAEDVVDQGSQAISSVGDATKNIGGGCLIATATYGSEMAPQVQQLRELRDNKLLKTESGASFMNLFNNFYYSFSSHIADYERENPMFKEIVKAAITPLVTSLSILNYVDVDSEESVLGYGISLILLNIGMYFAFPVMVVIGIKKKL